MELPQKSLTRNSKNLFVPINIQKDWKAKLESAYSFMLKYSKITVWVVKWPFMNNKFWASVFKYEQIRKTDAMCDFSVLYYAVLRKLLHY